MTEEQERAKFEAWRRSTTKMSPDDAVARDGIGELSEYENRTTRAMWIGWKGRALAALSQPAGPAPEAPTDEQLISLAEKHRVWSKYGLEDAPKMLSFCRDVLALSQRNPASPAAPNEARII